MYEMNPGVAKKLEKSKRKQRYDSKLLAKYRSEYLANYMAYQDYRKSVMSVKKVKVLSLKG